MLETAYDDLIWSEDDESDPVESQHSDIDIMKAKKKHATFTEDENLVTEGRILLPNERTLTIHDGSLRLNSHPDLLPHEEKFISVSNFRIPLPYLPPHIKSFLGDKFINDLWNQFLSFDVNESGLLEFGKLLEIFKCMENLGYKVPFHLLKFDLDEDDYVEYTEVIEEISKLLSSEKFKSSAAEMLKIEQKSIHKLRITGCRAVIIDNNKRKLTLCCSNHSCICEHKLNYQDKVPEKNYNSGSHRLNVIFNRFNSDLNNKVRVRHVPAIMDEAKIPYDLKRKPKSYWDLQKDFYITTMNQLMEIITEIRTDKDEIVDLNYAVPVWLTKEFSKPEIIMFRNRFQVADYDTKTTLTPAKLKVLMEGLGLRMNIEECEKLVKSCDMRGVGSITFSEFLGMMFKLEHGALKILSDTEGLLEKIILEAKSQNRVFEEIENINSDIRNSDADVEAFQYNPIAGVKISRYGGFPVSCEFSITGPQNTPYEGGEFKFIVTFDGSYPFSPPICKFLTRIYCINVYCYMNGEGILPHIKAVWRPEWDVMRLLLHVMELLRNPDINLVPENVLELLELCQPQTQSMPSAQYGSEEGESRFESQPDEYEFDQDDYSDETDVVNNKMIQEGNIAPETSTEVESVATESQGDTRSEETKEIVAAALSKSYNRMDLIHFNMCLQYLTNRSAYESFAREFTQRFAVKS